jgi:L-ascorbate metabolism protein UlaG (beta-lactamase superfamily)
MQITYIGHATLLIEIDGVRVLTDPNFEDTLAGFLPRVSPPGIPIGELPALDAVLITHAHADHLSFKALDVLPRDVPVYAPPVIARWLHQRGYGHVSPLAPNDSVRVRALHIHAAAARHKGNRYGYDRRRAAANMYLLETRDESCFFAGDTGLGETTHLLVERILWFRERELDVALLPIGYAPWWKRKTFREGHLTSEDALELFSRLRARHLIPYHWGTFRHVTVGAHAAITRFRDLVVTHPRGPDVRIIEPGEALEVAAVAAAA